MKKLLPLLLFLSACQAHHASVPVSVPVSVPEPPQVVAPKAAQPPLARSYLFCSKFPDVILRTHPTGWGMSCFAEVEGIPDAYSTIDKLAASGKFPFVKVNLWWRDGHDYDRPGSFPTIASRAARVDAILSRYPGVRCYVSGATEHTLGNARARQLANAVKAASPHCTYINNPMKNGAKLSGEVNETHSVNSHPPSPRYTVDTDGKSIDSINVREWKRRYAGAIFAAGWNHDDNCKRSDNDRTPRPKRKACLTDRKNREIIQEMRQ